MKQYKCKYCNETMDIVQMTCLKNGATKISMRCGNHPGITYHEIIKKREKKEAK
jgi:hypothetical protein